MPLINSHADISSGVGGQFMVWAFTYADISSGVGGQFMAWAFTYIHTFCMQAAKAH